MLRRQFAPNALPVGSAVRTVRHLYRQAGKGALAVRQFPGHRVPGNQQHRQQALLLYGGIETHFGGKAPMAGADRLLVRQGQRYKCTRRGRERGRTTHGNAAVQTQSRHDHARSDHLQGVRRRIRIDGLLGRTERPHNEFCKCPRPHSGLQVVYRPGAQEIQ